MPLTAMDCKVVSHNQTIHFFMCGTPTYKRIRMFQISEVDYREVQITLRESSYSWHIAILFQLVKKIKIMESFALVSKKDKFHSVTK